MLIKKNLDSILLLSYFCAVLLGNSKKTMNYIYCLKETGDKVHIIRGTLFFSALMLSYTLIMMLSWWASLHCRLTLTGLNEGRKRMQQAKNKRNKKIRDLMKELTALSLPSHNYLIKEPESEPDVCTKQDSEWYYTPEHYVCKFH